LAIIQGLTQGPDGGHGADGRGIAVCVSFTASGAGPWAGAVALEQSMRAGSSHGMVHRPEGHTCAGKMGSSQIKF
jgi:hypothetical protein